jgi:molecular chaperone GrpE (heat shock protein)
MPGTSSNKIPLGKRPLRASEMIASLAKMSGDSSAVKLASLEAALNEQSKMVTSLIENYNKVVHEQVQMRKQIEVETIFKYLIYVLGNLVQSEAT